MGGVKRKEAPVATGKPGKKQRVSTEKERGAGGALKASVSSPEDGEDEGFNGLSDDGDGEGDAHVPDDAVVDTQHPPKRSAARHSDNEDKKFKLDTTSAETHAKQRQLAKERRAAKPNADSIQRSKKIWERLRIKSAVPKQERQTLVEELFTIINGRVRDFVFKHDSVRVVQCALKYANMEQRKMIAHELQGDVRALAESKYGKFLVAKLVVEGDHEIRDMVVPEFYGHIKRLVNHPEASWIVDDIYRQVASVKQKAIMLREWYGTEYALENRERQPHDTSPAQQGTSDLALILGEYPEKRKPILEHTLGMINSLVQKKMTGFTMLHDAMLQYFLVLAPDSEEHSEFLEILKGDIDKDTEGGGGDLYKNLAFTKSGSRLVCLAIAYGSAKDRKTILRVFKDTIEMMAFDNHAKMILVVALDVPDDTTMTTKAVYRELLGEKIEDGTQRLERLEGIVVNLNARVALLYPLAGRAKWLLSDQEKALLKEVHGIRSSTSKKAPELRRKGLLEYLSPHALELVVKRAAKLAGSSFGCQFMTEALLECIGEKEEAKTSVASLAEGSPAGHVAEGGGEGEQKLLHISQNPAASRMLKTLVQGGNFDPKTKKTQLADPRLGFGEVLHPVIKDRIVEWACSDSSFVVLALLESEDVPIEIKDKVKKTLSKAKNELKKAAGDHELGHKGFAKTEKPGKVSRKGNAGARMLLEQL